MSANAPPLLLEIARTRAGRRAAAWQEAVARWEGRIPAALTGAWTPRVRGAYSTAAP
jgi:hypothetical protein